MLKVILILNLFTKKDSQYASIFINIMLVTQQQRFKIKKYNKKLQHIKNDKQNLPDLCRTIVSIPQIDKQRVTAEKIGIGHGNNKPIQD